MKVIDKTHILERELLAKRGIITVNGQEQYVKSRSTITGAIDFGYDDVIYIYVPWPRSLFNWFGRKHCGTINVDKKIIKIFRNHNECYSILKTMPFFNDFEVEIK